MVSSLGAVASYVVHVCELTELASMYGSECKLATRKFETSLRLPPSTTPSRTTKARSNGDKEVPPNCLESAGVSGGRCKCSKSRAWGTDGKQKKKCDDYSGTGN
jgi:hypothetical protein